MEKHLFQVMILYSDPLSIQTTTVVKAVAYSSEDTTKVESHTYVYVDDVIDQANSILNFPIGTGFSNFIKSDVTYRPMLDDALQAIPFMSLSLDLEDYNFIYTNKGISKIAHIEFYDPILDDSYHRPAGVTTYGKASFSASDA